MLAVYKIFKIQQLNSKAHLGCLSALMAPIASCFIPIDKWPVFEENIIVRMVL